MYIVYPCCASFKVLAMAVQIDLHCQSRLYPTLSSLIPPWHDWLSAINVSGMPASSIIMHEAKTRIDRKQSAAIQLLWQNLSQPLLQNPSKQLVIHETSRFHFSISVKFCYALPGHKALTTWRKTSNQLLAFLFRQYTLYNCCWNSRC